VTYPFSELFFFNKFDHADTKNVWRCDVGSELCAASWVEKVKMPLSSDNPHEKYELVELLGEG
jgi:hypothetical protein